MVLTKQISPRKLDSWFIIKETEESLPRADSSVFSMYHYLSDPQWINLFSTEVQNPLLDFPKDSLEASFTSFCLNSILHPLTLQLSPSSVHKLWSRYPMASRARSLGSSIPSLLRSRIAFLKWRLRTKQYRRGFAREFNCTRLSDHRKNEFVQRKGTVSPKGRTTTNGK